MSTPGTDEFREFESSFPDDMVGLANDMVGLANSMLSPVLTVSNPNENVAADVVTTEFPTILNGLGEGVTPNLSLIIATFRGAVLIQLAA